MKATGGGDDRRERGELAGEAMAGGVEAVEWEMEGEALRVRRLSRRLVFFDLLLSRPPLFHSPCSALVSSGLGKGSLLGGAGRGGNGAATVEVVLKGPTGKEDVRAQGREVKLGAMLRVRGSAIEWKRNYHLSGEEPGGSAGVGARGIGVAVPGTSPPREGSFPSPESAACYELTAISSYVTRLVPLHSADTAQLNTPAPIGGSSSPAPEAPASGSASTPVLVPRQRPQEWNTLAHLPQLPHIRETTAGTTSIGIASGGTASVGESGGDAPLLLSHRAEDLAGPQQDVMQQNSITVCERSSGFTGEEGHQWELMAPPGTGYATEPTHSREDTEHDDTIHNDDGYRETVHSDAGHRDTAHTDSGHRYSKVQGGSCGGDEERGALQGVCRGWLNTGQCLASDAGLCAHRHPPPGELSALRQEWVSARLSRRAELRGVDPFDPLEEGSKERRQGRARVFAAWLVGLLGAERLSAGSGVLDVAGGRGPLSFALAAIHGVPCTLLDPRPRKLSRFEAKLLKRESKRLKKREGLVDDPSIRNEGADDPFAAEPLGEKARVGDRGSAEGGVPAADGTCLERTADHSDGAPTGGMRLPGGSPEEGGSLGAPSKEGGSLGGPSTGCMRCIQGEFYACEPKWQEQARAHSCLVGLHPDQVTGDIVFAAVANRQPFAVVPCCVFPGRFAQRHLRCTGQWVQSPEELCLYLMEMCRAGGGVAQRSWLPFKGRNAVVYCTHYEPQ